jgi:tRNA nucleotidyltransferase/poly(A) polymerase
MKTLAERLKFSTREANRLKDWSLTAAIGPETTEAQLAKTLYRGVQQGVVDRLRLALASARGRAVEDDKAMIEAGGFSRLLAYAQKWEKPVFPVKGADLTALGAAPGPELGAMLTALENDWIESAFTLDRGALLERAAKALG